jgi:hypothetical protein
MPTGQALPCAESYDAAEKEMSIKATVRPLHILKQPFQVY